MFRQTAAINAKDFDDRNAGGNEEKKVNETAFAEQNEQQP